jgi:hypothetical protein
MELRMIKAILAKTNKAKLENRYKELQKELSQIGYICNGSILSLYRKCGKPNCGCNENSEEKHGPYYIWTRKENGKTITRSLSKERFHQCQKCIKNYKKMEKIIEEMKKISVQIFEQSHS